MTIKDDKKPTLDQIAEHIKFILLDKLGRENAIKRPVLLSVLQVVDHRITDRDMRKAIEKCLPETCMCASGYFFPRTDAEVRATVEYMIQKMKGIRKRVDAIAESYPTLEKFIQGELFR